MAAVIPSYRMGRAADRKPPFDVAQGPEREPKGGGLRFGVRASREV